MKGKTWFSLLSSAQRAWLAVTLLLMAAIVITGYFFSRDQAAQNDTEFNVSMSMSQIAPKLGVTGKSLARELDLPLDTAKKKPLKDLGIQEKQLAHVVEHLLSHRDTNLKYYVFAALVLWGLVFLARLGRPDESPVAQHAAWYPRWPYLSALVLAVAVAGFALGKSPNPMEGIVKVFKSMMGLYPDPWAKVLALVFFLALAVVGNKLICGWACPFGALQELVYTLPLLKKRKPPFWLTNTIRLCLFIAMILFLFGLVGGKKGLVIYHPVNPFNLFNLDFETWSIILVVAGSLVGSFIMYRPFCQLICPFGFVSWLAERLSLVRVVIDREKCIDCGKCVIACPLDATKGRLKGTPMPADCFSCARCLRVCPVDAISYRLVLPCKNVKTQEPHTP